MAWTRRKNRGKNVSVSHKAKSKRNDIEYVKANFVFTGLRFLICVVLLSALGGTYYFFYTSGILGSAKPTGELNAAAPKLAFHVIDVGCADSLFIQFPDGKNMMLDCGFSVNTQDQYKYSTIYSYLTDTVGLQKGDKIDYIVNTHTDGDHYNGFVSLLRDFEIGEIWIPWVSTDGSNEWGSPTYEDNSGFTTFIKKSIEEVGIEKVHPLRADRLTPITNDAVFGDDGDDYRIRFITPTEAFIRDHLDTVSKPNEYNNTVSAMMTLEFGEQIIVLTGDAEGETESEFIEISSSEYPAMFTSGKHVYLKAAHHGADTKGSNSQEFLNFIKPEFAFVSAGHDYNDAHPAAEVTQRLTDFCGENVYVTKNIGNIKAVLDGRNVEINGVIKTEAADSMKLISVSGAFIFVGILIIITCFHKFKK